ncbi:hypothetical protein BJ508DRAFT_213205, partial [Ascobolus immersus RN42]
KIYGTKDSRVVTLHSTNLAIRSLRMGKRTGSRMFFSLWPYMKAKQACAYCPGLKIPTYPDRLCRVKHILAWNHSFGERALGVIIMIRSINSHSEDRNALGRKQK